MEYDEIILKFVEQHAYALTFDPYLTRDKEKYKWLIGREVLDILAIHNDIVYEPRSGALTIMGIKYIVDCEQPFAIRLYKEIL